MKQAQMDFSGVVSTTKNVHGVDVRGLNFAELSIQWQSNGTRLIDVYEEIIKATENTENDTLTLVNAIITHAPDLARAAFLAAINDKGELRNIGNGEMMTAGEIWDSQMSVGRQIDFIVAILELTLNEADDLKKKAMGWFSNLKVAQPTYMGETESKILAAITQ